MEKIITCKRCDGAGYVWDKSEIILTGLLSYGLAPLLANSLAEDDEDNDMKKRCPKCDGHGLIKIVNTDKLRSYYE